MTPIKPSAAFPDFEDRKIVDGYLDRLDTHGVSRRDFLALASAGAAAGVAAAAMGLPSVAVADPSGKIAYLAWSACTEYNQLVSKGAEAASKALGLNYVFLDGQIDSNRQLNQFEQLTTTKAAGGFFNILDGSALRRVGQVANDTGTYFGAVWDSVAWYTPFDAGDYYTLYAVPEEDEAHRGVSAEVLKAVTATFGGGDVVALTGTPGNWCENARNRGRDDAFKDFPKTRLVDQLPGKWLREESLKATEDLLTRNKAIAGIITQNDDEAQGALAALRNAGIRPGREVFVGGADGTSLGAQAIKRGLQTATSGNSPVFTGALFAARIHDVTHGWRPKAAERQLYWRAITVTEKNVDGYIDRYVDNREVEPFDYRKLSRVLHPNDWDPQADVYPIDLERHWRGYPKPDGWAPPKAYAHARASGEFEAVKEEYADHYRIKFDGPSPNRKV
ncbi:sugar ABC transporter substrate-binding protein [Chelatococcus reniformis]|uniref:ABC transporter substrate-binding protein n=1 Tax=Chelatococcus reniformis TaxID=1494448 RepID=A0A916TWU1_9HYPH|nr:sugar ABC transporter substrate-binding protein [Chelatococcus reniformis]GGC45881.1 ABC transporter substrate-binding protein [Chelatococcus reniformis]